VPIIVGIDESEPQPGLTSVVFPLEPPLLPGPASLKFRQQSLVAVVPSVYTKQEQVQEFPAEWWEIEFSHPPMLQQKARAWCAFLGALRGRAGTFLVGDRSLPIPQGFGGSPDVTVNGGSQSGRTLSLSFGAGSANQVVMRSGDYLQIGRYAGMWTGAGRSYLVGDSVWNNGNAYWCTGDHVGSATYEPGVGAYWPTYWVAVRSVRQRLHINLTDVTADSSGNATLDIWPALRESPPNGCMVVLNSPRGIFRLTSNAREWDVNSAKQYGISFAAAEVLL